MKKTLIAAALAAATAFSVTPAALAETTNEVQENPNDKDTPETPETPEKDKDKDKEKDKDEDDKDKNDLTLDPTKDMWDKNNASSNPAPEGPFNAEKSSTLNRVSAYYQSNHFKMISLIVGSVATIIGALANFAAVIIGSNPELKARFAAMFPA
ncbi:hypothetical protein [Corynebacterium meitnerae]|uniref:Uncharacterized protein n=1 Tax=Corynebacterium meitnerae TaxID=2913498 RepID=A0A9X3RIU6_9CORY|nr:hypothetical protein [Corynebacterium meitnerae]MCZ9293270.1 hypothetical protein [Corynebacterium meitnerae]